ncbi:hypothetical protein GYMLUDRAFT_370116 [Collybiopsis luxurians FD-317 M1]|nr:hypothetical protein GYMLUDRAFT_370116 [Collybiopsis luxurians FD-317 M1]
MSNGSPPIDTSLEAIRKYARSLYGIPEQYLLGIPGLLQSLDRDLVDYRNEISRLETELQSARARYEGARKKTITLRSLLAPIHRLPNELLIYIFDCVCDDVFDSWSIKMSNSPFFLSAVCGRWRFLCLSHPKMWSKFDVHCTTGSKGGNAVDLYIERSKPQLLTIHISYFPNGPLNRGEHNMLFQKLVNCSARWRHVMFNLEFLSQEFPYLSRLEFPALEILDIKGIADGAADLGVFTCTPKLQTLEAWVELIPNQEVLNRITKLVYTTLDSPGNLLEVLHLCSNLRILEIYADEEIGFSNWPIMIPTLTSLHVEGGEDIFERVFRSLVAPALTTLQISHYYNCGDAVYSHIAQFLDRSGCLPTTLVIETDCAGKTILGLLQRLPLLKELSVRDHRAASHSSCSHIIAEKVLMESPPDYRPSHPLTVPKLHSLSLMVALTGFDHKSFVEMILSRWIPDEDYAALIGVSCIKSVTLRLPEPVDEVEYLPLVQLRKSGLCFYLQR